MSFFTVETFFIGEYTYYVLEEKANFKDSEKICRESRAELASFGDTQERKIFNQVVQSYPFHTYGIGYYIPKSGGGKWSNAYWTDGTDQTYVKNVGFAHIDNAELCSRAQFHMDEIKSLDCNSVTYYYMCKKKGIHIYFILLYLCLSYFY